MKPTLVEGDFILVDKFSHVLRLPIIGKRISQFGDPKRGDVIVFKGSIHGKPSRLIKRVIGLPGDHIVYKDKILYINDNPQPQAFQGMDMNVELNGFIFPVIKEKTKNLIKLNMTYITPPHRRIECFLLQTLSFQKTAIL